MNRRRLFWVKVIFSALGAVGGFLYWKLEGCTSRTCAIKSVWYFSTLWGLALGYLLADLLGSFIMKREAEHE